MKIISLPHRLFVTKFRTRGRNTSGCGRLVGKTYTRSDGLMLADKIHRHKKTWFIYQVGK